MNFVTLTSEFEHSENSLTSSEIGALVQTDAQTDVNVVLVKPENMKKNQFR